MLAILTRDEVMTHTLQFLYPCHGEGRALARRVRVEKCGNDFLQCQNLPIPGKNPPARPYSTYNLSKIVGDIHVIERGEYVNPQSVQTE